MPDEPVKKRVDESWKERAEREKQHTPAAPPPGHPAPGPEPAHGASAPAHEHGHDESAHAEPQGEEGQPQARFDMFLSSLAMETLIALGDMAHPVTRKKSSNLAQAKYLIDLLGVLEEKTAGNLTVDEEQLFKDTLYQLRMRYLAKSGG
jgi:hypothetical protein